MKKSFLTLCVILFTLYSIWYIVFAILNNTSFWLQNNPTETTQSDSKKPAPVLVETKQEKLKPQIEIDLTEQTEILQKSIPIPKKIVDPEVIQGTEYFTIQVSSSRNLKDAERDFRKLIAQLSEEEKQFLRIEKVQNFYTVRLGKFQDERAAKQLLEKLANDSPGALTLSAYIKPERIVRSTETLTRSKPEFVQVQDKSVTLKRVDTQKDKEVELVIVKKELVHEEEGPAGPEETVVSDEVIEELVDAGNIEGKKDEGGSSKEIRDKKELGEEKAGVPDSEQVKDKEGEGPPEETNKFSYEVVKNITQDDNGEKIKGPISVFYDHTADEMLSVMRGRIVIYGSDFFPLNSFGEGRGLSKVRAGVIDDKGKVYICQDGDQKSGPLVSILNPALIKETDIRIKEFEEAGGFSPTRVAIGAEGRIYLVGNGSSRVLVLDSQGKFLRWIEIQVRKKEKGENKEEKILDKPFSIVDIASDSKGNLFFLSESLGKVYVFNAKEEYLFSFGKKGGSTGKLSRPRGITLDEKRKAIYVVDYFRHTVLIYDYSGKYKYQLGGRGWSPGWFDFPVDVAVSKHGYLVVADFFNDRIQAFKVNFPDDFLVKNANFWWEN